MLEAIQFHIKENSYIVNIYYSSTKNDTIYIGCDCGKQYQA
jgi:hypothetical protein